MLNAGRLSVFREVISHGSFSAAADALSYSQSAVSQAIATLEGEIGAPLIERSRGGVRPTPAGAALAGHVGGILAQMEAAEAEIGAIAAGHKFTQRAQEGIDQIKGQVRQAADVGERAYREAKNSSA